MYHHQLCSQLGFLPSTLCPMGKWEPTMRPEDCLREVSARAAAALAIAEALTPPGASGPYLLSAEGHLRRMSRPGCTNAAQILVDLGADPGRIRVWPAANRTLVELQTLRRMVGRLGGGGLLLVTSNYHVPRTAHILRRDLPGDGQMVVIGTGHTLVRAALAALPPGRRRRLALAMNRGRRRGLRKLTAVVQEGVGFVTGAVPGLEGWIADTVRGRVRPEDGQMLRPVSGGCGALRFEPDAEQA
jgi:hypothetical protein